MIFIVQQKREKAQGVREMDPSEDLIVSNESQSFFRASSKL